MSREVSPETPIANLSASTELLAFANHYDFSNLKEMLSVGLNQLRNFDGFDYRLQREIVTLLELHHWENLLEPGY
jgi:hypothetical protein